MRLQKNCLPRPLLPLWAILISVFLLLATQPVSAAPSYTVYLTGTAIEGVPSNQKQTQFDCSEKVYLVLELYGMEKQEHLLQVKWFDPRNKLEEHTRYKFEYIGDGTRIWAWLRLSGPPGAAIGRVFDPSFGMGAFIGEWRAEVLINGKQISKQKFSVLC